LPENMSGVVTFVLQKNYFDPKENYLKTLTISLLFTLVFSGAHGQEDPEGDANVQKVVRQFISIIKNREEEKLVQHISFPFERAYPIPDIKSKQEFFKRYNEVFDDSLVKLISRSDPVKDWSAMGSQGIMFLNGPVWLDFDGRLICVNYQSHAEKQMRDLLIENERTTLHASIRKYTNPVHILETAKYRIRIDELGEGRFRYVSWPIENKMSDKPDLVMEGEVDYDGTGGNYHYTFKRAGYTYECSIVVLGNKNSPPAYLRIYKGEKEILSQRAEIIKK
jgi:hypothetical protein